MILRKKGTMTTWEVVLMILAIIVLAVLIWQLFLGSDTFAKGIKKDCVADLNGVCSTAYLQCGPGYKVSLTPAICDKDGKQTCCVSTSQVQPDELCKGKKSGDSCAAANQYKVCSDTLQCIPKCEYCDKKPNDSQCSNVFNDANKKIDFGLDFGCSCTLTQCNSKMNNGTCVKRFCPGTTYCCTK